MGQGEDIPMQLRFAAPVAVLALAGATVPAIATSRPASAIEYASPHAVRGDLGPANGAPTAWAAKALRAQAGRLGVDASTYKFESLRTSLIGTHVRGRQFRGGLPIDGTDVLVTAIAGRVAQVDAYGTALPGSPVKAPVGEVVARAAAVGVLNVTRLRVPTVTERLLVQAAGHVVDTYRVWVVAATPARAARVDIDAATGRVLAVVEDAKRAKPINGKAKVFDPNPIQSTRNPALREPGETHQAVDPDLDSAELTAARKWMPLKGLDSQALSSGQLSGPWVNVIGLGGYIAPSGSLSFDITRGDPRFEGLMAYAHLDGYQRYLQRLGFRNVNNESQDIVAAPIEGYDNSFYQPGNDVMVLGAGGVDDGEDAEVILHEYGHAIQDAQVQGWGATEEGGAMGEGFGDFNAANYFARTSHGGYYDVCLMEWDSTSYSTKNPTCIRRMDGKKRYPKNVDGEVHDDGEMWSAYLWRVRSHLPGNAVQKSDAAIKLVLTSHELLTSQAKFANAVAALRTAARALHHPEYVSFINHEARVTGFRLHP